MSKVVYKVSSTAKVEQMEAELSAQLSALKTEIEENGSPLETPSKSYSSVPVPKDVSYFRMEREQVLRRGLQVAEALPVMSPSDVLQRELESCLCLEWRRFCRHSHIIEQLYPFYKRARRLAVSREKVLTGRGNPINTVTQEDVTIYLTWLVIHYIPASEKRDKDSSELLRKFPSSSPVLVESVHTSSEDKDQVLAGLEGNIDCYLIEPLH
ncbi:unnamed protein product [Coregonus sp. 'balchen']|nr:unnamed protein product [Coregonus sp. 'balchen']